MLHIFIRYIYISIYIYVYIYKKLSATQIFMYKDVWPRHRDSKHQYVCVLVYFGTVTSCRGLEKTVGLEKGKENIFPFLFSCNTM